jgi:YHS domain-containing protein
MIRAFFVEIVFPAIVFLLLISLAKSVLRALQAGFNAPSEARPEKPVVQAGGDLKKDPVCGTYVSTATSLSRVVGGQAVYFCSEECRKKFARRG